MEEEEVLVSEEHVQTLLAMGICEGDAEIRNALKQTGNNLEDALQILLPDTERQLSYGTDDMETRADSSCSDHDSTTATYSLEPERIQELVDDSIEYHRDDDSMGEELPHPQYHEDNSDPPCYQDVVDEHKTLPSSEEQPSTMEEEDETPPPLTSSPVPPLVSNIEFPLTHFYELEGRVHTEQWSIPYKKEESLGKCLLASIAMMKEGRVSPFLVFLLFLFFLVLFLSTYIHILPCAICLLLLPYGLPLLFLFSSSFCNHMHCTVTFIQFTTILNTLHAGSHFSGSK